MHLIKVRPFQLFKETLRRFSVPRDNRMLQPEELASLTLAQLDSYVQRMEGVLVNDVKAVSDKGTYCIALDGASCPFYAEGMLSKRSLFHLPAIN